MTVYDSNSLRIFVDTNYAVSLRGEGYSKTEAQLAEAHDRYFSYICHFASITGLWNTGAAQ